MGALELVVGGEQRWVATQQVVHMYLDVDDREIFAALGRLDDLRAFAVVVQRPVDA